MYFARLFFAIFTSVGVLADSTQTKNKKNDFVIEKIEFDDHTYIHYWNRWSHADNGFLHDPSCKCFILAQERMKKLLNIKEEDK